MQDKAPGTLHYSYNTVTNVRYLDEGLDRFGLLHAISLYYTLLYNGREHG
jgi:hypothetical protein